MPADQFNDAFSRRHAPVGALYPPVKLTPAQSREWDVTRARFLSATPAFAHVLYTMMSYADGRMATFTDALKQPDGSPGIAATDGFRLLLDPAGFFALDLNERVFVIAHEVCHAIMDHCGQSHVHAKRGTIVYSDGVRLPFDMRVMNIALDLVSHAEAAVRDGSLVSHRRCSCRGTPSTNPAVLWRAGFGDEASPLYKVRATSLTSKNSSWSPSAMSL